MSSDFQASSNGIFSGANFKFRCAIGRSGMTEAENKREGDGASPIGRWPMRRVFYRADKVEVPETDLPRVPIGKHDGWCDDPDDPLYNRPVTLPYPASHEKCGARTMSTTLLLSSDTMTIRPFPVLAVPFSCILRNRIISLRKDASRSAKRTFEPC